MAKPTINTEKLPGSSHQSTMMIRPSKAPSKAKIKDSSMIEAIEKELSQEDELQTRKEAKCHGIKEEGLCGGDILIFRHNGIQSRVTLSICFIAPDGGCVIVSQSAMSP
jgi:hypothetical protein